MDEPAAARGDPLGEALHYLRMSGAFYYRSDLTEPWAMALRPMAGLLFFHVVTSGRCTLEIEGVESHLLQPGDLALVPHGEGHRLASQPGLPAPVVDELPIEQISERYGVVRHGGGGPAATLICGAVRFDHAAARQLVALLPRIIHLEASSGPQMERIRSVLRLMAAEARELSPGGETVITRLADVVVIQAIRWWIRQDPAAQTGWLGALQDAQIGRAIALIHQDPAQHWTLASLARRAAMSRSAFAARFRELVGEPPMQYLARWRMHIAEIHLREHDGSLGDLAHRLGYQSEAAFSRAFKKFIGVPPGAVRRANATAQRTSAS